MNCDTCNAKTTTQGEIVLETYACDRLKTTCLNCCGCDDHAGEPWFKPAGWVYTEEKDISFEHCGQPAYWDGDLVFCSKCQEQLPETEEVTQS